jgi:hypothetical protein
MFGLEGVGNSDIPCVLMRWLIKLALMLMPKVGSLRELSILKSYYPDDILAECILR